MARQISRTIKKIVIVLTACIAMGGGGGEPHLKPTKLEHTFVAVITFSPSSVQVIILPACCLLCVL